MVLAAVREDRMPGGRNSGAVYNLYKVKYRKHKKPANGTSPQTQHQNNNHNNNNNLSAATTTTGILKSALTCPRDSAPFVGSVGSRAPNVAYITSPFSSTTNAMPTTTASAQMAVTTTTSSVSTTTSSPIIRQMHALMTRDPVMTREESDQLLNALIECDDFADFG